MLKKIAFALAGLTLLASPLVVLADTSPTISDLSGDITTCLTPPAGTTPDQIQTACTNLIQALLLIVAQIHAHPPNPSSGLTISAGTQPSNTIAPQGAQVPFTSFTLTNTGSASVTVNQLLVTTTGPIGAFHDVCILQKASSCITATFDQFGQATVNTSISIPAGSSQTFWVEGDMAANLATYAGQTVQLSLTALSTTAQVTGTLPIIGATNTINSTLNACFPPQTAIYGYQCWSASSGGTFTVATDASSPSYQIVAGGSKGVTLGVFDINTSVSGAGVTLQNIGLKLVSGSAQDVGQVYLYSGTHLLGTAIFTGNSLSATSTLLSSPLLNDTLSPQITVKADINGIGVGQPAVAGDLIQINVAGVQGVDQNSGASVSAYSNVGTGAGVRIFRSYPTVSLIGLPADGLSDGRLLRFSVTASPAGPIALAQIALGFSGLVANTNGQADVCAFTDAGYSQPIAGFSSGCINGLPLTGGSVGGYIPFPKPVEIPAGATYYFEVHDSTKGSGLTNEPTLTTTLGGESAFAGPLATDAAFTGHAFVWSPNDNGTSQFSDMDWASGYGVAGLPAGGFSQTRSNGPTPVPPPPLPPLPTPNPITTACPINFTEIGTDGNYAGQRFCSLSHLIGVHSVSGLTATLFSFIRPGLSYALNYGDGTEVQAPTCLLPTAGVPNSCNDAAYPTHTYAKAGTYNVSVIDYSCGSVSCFQTIDSTSVTVPTQTSSAVTPNANVATALSALEAALKAFLGH